MKNTRTFSVQHNGVRYKPGRTREEAQANFRAGLRADSQPSPRASSAPQSLQVGAMAPSGRYTPRIVADDYNTPRSRVAPVRSAVLPSGEIDMSVVYARLDEDTRMRSLPQVTLDPEVLPDAQRQWRRCARRLARTYL